MPEHPENYDVASRLAQGRPAVDTVQEYVWACRELGYQHQDLTLHPSQVSDWYGTEDGMDLEVLHRGCLALEVAVRASQEALAVQDRQLAQLSVAWQGVGGEGAHDFLHRHGDASTAVAAAVRTAAEALAALREGLWKAVVAKVDAAVAIEARAQDSRAEWLAAAATVTTGVGDRSAASELLDGAVKPFVDSSVRTDWLAAMQTAVATVTAAYERAVAEIGAEQRPTFDVPGGFGPAWTPPAPVCDDAVSNDAVCDDAVSNDAVCNDAAVNPGAVNPGAGRCEPAGAVREAAAAPAPAAPTAWSGPAATAPAAAPAPAAPAPAMPAPVAPVPTPPAPMGSMGSPVPDLGAGLSGLGQQFADTLSGLLGGAGGGLAGGADGAIADFPEPDLPEPELPEPDPSEMDAEAEDGEAQNDEEAEGAEEAEEAEEGKGDEADPADVVPAEDDAGTAEPEEEPCEPVDAPVPTPAPLPAEPLPPADPAAADQTPCEIAADEVPQVGGPPE